MTARYFINFAAKALLLLGLGSYTLTANAALGAASISVTPTTAVAGATLTQKVTIVGDTAANTSSLAFTETYVNSNPVNSGMTNLATAATTSSCGSPTVTANSGTSYMSVSNGSIVKKKTCTISKAVKVCPPAGSTYPYSYTIPSFTISSSRGSTTATASNTVSITQPTSPLNTASTIVANPTAVKADGATTSTITVSLKDACGNAITGWTVTLAQTGASVITTTNNGSATGVATFTVKNSTVQSVTYTATASKSGSTSVTVSTTAAVNFTSTAVPNVTLGATSPTSATSASFAGTVSTPATTTATVSFEYGTTPAFGSSIAATPASVTSTTAVSVSAAPSTLACNTLYYVRLAASNANGTAYSTSSTFTTQTCKPSATTDPATDVIATNGGYLATANATVSSNGLDTTVGFEYGVTTSYEGGYVDAIPSIISGVIGSPNTDNVENTLDLDGLNCNTTLHYRVKAVNSAGTTYGADTTFSTGACSRPFSATACAAQRFNDDLGCTANDVSITSLALGASNTATSCVAGQTITVDVDATIKFASPNRYDVGVFVARDGLEPDTLPDNGGSSSCYVYTLPIGTPYFLNLDGTSTGDTCGDGNSSMNGGTGTGVLSMPGITVTCHTTPTSGGKLAIPFVISWDNKASPIGYVCQSNTDPVPVTAAKCSAPTGTLNTVNVTVLPTVVKTANKSSTYPGDTVSFTVTITNNGSETLSGLSFKDPAISELTTYSVTCSGASGMTCPTSGVTVTNMQATGIPLPDMPANGRLTFTVGATVSGTITADTTLTNNAYICNLSTGYCSASPGSVILSVSVVRDFNAFETSTATAAITGSIYTKRAGVAFSLDIVAIAGIGASATKAINFNNNVKVELLANTGSTPGSGYGTDLCPTSNTVLETQSTVTFVNGRKTVSFAAQANAYREVKVRMTYTGSSPSVIRCSIDSFAIRPDAFTLVAKDADWTTAGTTRTLSTSTAGSGITHKAGRPFTFIATAYNGASTPVATSNYTGTPTRTLSACTGTACTSTFGTFSPGATTFTSDTLSSNLATYTEVGAFNLTLTDTDFAAIDASDTAGDCTTSGRYICSAATTIGRFVPDHFTITAPSTTNSCTIGATPFTYFGEDGFTTIFTLTARDANENLTTNYAGNGGSGSLARLPLTSWVAAPASAGTPGFGFAASTWTPSQPGGAALASSTTMPTATNSNAWVTGTATVTAKHVITRPATSSPAEPSTVTVTALPVDSDGVTVSAAATLGSTLQRYGRLKISNAFGSGKLPLLMPAQLEYYSGGRWVLNSDDACTKLSVLSGPVTPVTVGSGTTQASCLVTGGSCTTTANKACNSSDQVTGGQIGLCLSAPNTNGNARITFSPASYLLFNNASGLAGFGIYNQTGNARRIIDRREVR